MEGYEIVAGSEQKARGGGAESGWRFTSERIGAGFRQGFPISPLLFSIYADVMMIEALKDMKEGVLL